VASCKTKKKKVSEVEKQVLQAQHFALISPHDQNNLQPEEYLHPQNTQELLIIKSC
jgi:hypothetical protein